MGIVLNFGVATGSLEEGGGGSASGDTSVTTEAGRVGADTLLAWELEEGVMSYAICPCPGGQGQGLAHGACEGSIALMKLDFSSTVTISNF
jgi:hypothetical protein